MKRVRFVIGLLVIFASFVTLPAVWAKSAPKDTVIIALSTLHEETFLPWNGGGPRKFYLDTIYEYLFYLDPVTDKAIPGLAERWEMSEDGKIWTFFLRKGVPFNEGWGELSAEDVKYSVERLIDPKSIVGPASQMRRIIEKVEAPEKYKVVIYLKGPDSEFDRGYMGNTMCQPILSKKYVEQVSDVKANAHPIGTGPFTLAEYKKGISIKLKAIPGVEKHWRVKPDFE
ncbi:MAG: ABC transporter substrate-binding protein, partial [Desulfobacterales bacterium]|nr:ABC transporter substrate-binding protein [Desulfobacterales bacterium]